MLFGTAGSRMQVSSQRPSQVLFLDPLSSSTFSSAFHWGIFISMLPPICLWALQLHSYIGCPQCIQGFCVLYRCFHQSIPRSHEVYLPGFITCSLDKCCHICSRFLIGLLWPCAYTDIEKGMVTSILRRQVGLQWNFKSNTYAPHFPSTTNISANVCSV